MQQSNWLCQSHITIYYTLHKFYKSQYFNILLCLYQIRLFSQQIIKVNFRN